MVKTNGIVAWAATVISAFAVLAALALTLTAFTDLDFAVPGAATTQSDPIPHRSDADRVYFATPEIEALAVPMLAEFPYAYEERLPEWRLEFVPGDTEIAGYTWSHEYRIEVFVRPTSTEADLRRVLAHELGHAVDVTLNSGEERREWQAERGIAEHPWWPVSGEADFETGAGDFAESFASWLLGDELDFRSRIAPVPDVADRSLMTALALD